MACLAQNNQPLGVAGSEDPYIKSAWGDTHLVAWGFRARYYTTQRIDPRQKQIIRETSYVFSQIFTHISTLISIYVCMCIYIYIYVIIYIYIIYIYINIYVYIYIWSLHVTALL